MSRLVSAFTACLVSAVVLSGCGAEPDDEPTQGSSEETTSSATSESPDSAEPEEPAFDPSAAALTEAPFCGELDPGAAESALGVDSGQLELADERVVGKKYKNPVTGESAPSTSNACIYADAGVSVYFNVAVSPVAKASDVEASLKAKTEFVGDEGQSDKCTVMEETTYGDPGGVSLCTGVNYESTKGRSDVSILGLVGTSRFFCQAGLAKGSTPEEIEQPVRDLCLDVLQQLAAG